LHPLIVNNLKYGNPTEYDDERKGCEEHETGKERGDSAPSEDFVDGESTGNGPDVATLYLQAYRKGEVVKTKRTKRIV